MSPTTREHATPINDIYRTPEYMCWLCRRDIEATRGFRDHESIPRLALCRIISFSQAQDSTVSISGIGHRLPTSAFYDNDGIAFVIPCKQEHSVEGNSSPQASLNLRVIQDPVYCSDSQKWTFRVHADCWDLVESRTEPGNVKSLALSWCQALASLNWNFTTLAPGMGRYDLPRLLLSAELPTKLERGKRYSEARNMRLGIQRLVNFEELASELGLSNSKRAVPLSLSRLNLYTLPEQTSLQFTSTSSRTSIMRDIFSYLPHEILQQIILYTKTTDLVNFRLASRAVAYISRLEALPRSFWFSRFLPGFELSFALPVEIHKTRDIDWRGLYFLIRKALNNPDVVGGARESSALSRLARRKYWSDRFAGVSELCEDFGSQMRLEGIPLTWPPPPSVGHTGIVESEGQRTGCKGYVDAVSARLLRDDGTHRHYSTLSTTLPPSSDIAGVGISTVRLLGESYISGLRFFYKDGATPKSLGYVCEHLETIVQFREDDVFCGFDVRIDDDAVRALRVNYQTHTGEDSRSSWVGDVDSARAGSDIQPTPSIRRVKSACPGTLAASFDHFKMIVMGIIESESTQDNEDNPSTTTLASIIDPPVARKEKPTMTVNVTPRSSHLTAP